MKKLLPILILFLGLTGVFAEGEGTLAYPSTQKTLLEGQVLSIRPYNINNENYYRLRDLAAIFADTKAPFNVTYDEGKNEVFLKKGEIYEKIPGDLAPLPPEKKIGRLTAQKIYLVNEGEKDVVEAKVYNVAGNNYFRLRDLGKILDFQVNWEEAARRVKITLPLQEEIEDHGEKGEDPLTVSIPQGDPSSETVAVVYGFEACPYCRALKEGLKERGIPFIYKDIEENSAYQREFQKYGASYVPLTVIGDILVQGNQPDEIQRALGL